tara:strand:- start:2661 stop:3767 length:1107 start_codon:yes stop_codon:yes gene_type:complete
MANTIRIKKRASSGSAGAPSTLAPSELAFNENTGDLKLYYGYGDNGSGEASSVIAVGGSGAFFNKTDTRTANTILSGPTTGSAAAPTFRALVAADLLKLNEFTAPDGAVSLNSQKITGLAAPAADTDAATKGYVDSTSEGLDVKDSCKVATTANITLANTQTVDGVSLAANDRVLVKDQSTANQNGLYKVVDGGSWTRTDDMAAGSSAAGAFTFVEQGSTYADVGFVCSTNKGSDTVASDSLAFTQFSGAASITAGDGLDKSGNTLSLDIKSGSGLQITSTELDLDADLTALAGCQSGAAAALALLTSTEVAILDGATVTTAELNVLDGIPAGLTATELGYVDGVTSAIQTQLDAKLTSSSTVDGGTF